MADDRITVFPVFGWDAATLPDGEAMLAISFLPGRPPVGATAEELRASTQSLRLGMTAEQCDELAELLRKMAAASRKRRGAAN